MMASLPTISKQTFSDNRTLLHIITYSNRWDLVSIVLKHGANLDSQDQLKNTPLHAALHQPNVPLDVIHQLITLCNINLKNIEGNTSLHLGAKTLRSDLIHELIEYGADVDLCNDHYETPLHLSAESLCHAPDVIKLISKDNINKQDSNGLTALHLVVKHRNWLLVPVLIEHGADLNLQDKMKQTPLHAAVCQADIQEGDIKRLISSDNINMQDVNGFTAVHLAINSQVWSVLPVLIQNNADIGLSDHVENTPLHRAVCFGRAPIDIITKLTTSSNIDSKNRSGHTALQQAITWKSWNLVPVLVNNGSDVNICGYKGNTPLHECVNQPNAPLDVIRCLIMMSSHNINVQNKDKHTVLHLAVNARRWDLVGILATNGADVCIYDNMQMTPLHRAIKFKDVPLPVIFQLMSPVNLITTEQAGRTPLHLAVQLKRWDLVHMFVHNGADVSLCNMHGKTPLHLVRSLAHVPIDVVILLICAHNVNIKDGTGRTVFHEVVRLARWDLVPKLLHCGADFSLYDKDGKMQGNLDTWLSNLPLDIVLQIISSRNTNSSVVQHLTLLKETLRQARWDLIPVITKYEWNNDKTSKGQKTPLHLAIETKDVPASVIHHIVLTSSSSRRIVNMQDEAGCTPLQCALRQSRWDLVHVLKHYGSDVNICDELKMTPLHMALTLAHVPISVLAELVSDYSINSKDQHGRTVLHKVVQLEHITPEDVSMFASRKNINVQDEDRRTAILQAVAHGRWDLVPVLVKKGANVGLRDRWNISPLHYVKPDVPDDVLVQLMSQQNITLVHKMIRENNVFIIPPFLRYRKRFAIYDIAKIMMTGYNFDALTLLLQYLDMPCYLRHVEITFSEENFQNLMLNGKRLKIPQTLDISKLCLVNMICHLLQQTCVVKSQHYTQIDDIRTNVDPSIVSYVMTKHEEFKVISTNPTFLQKLCLIAIRQNINYKTKDNFGALGLPSGLLSLVTLRGLAEELDIMWWQGKKD